VVAVSLLGLKIEMEDFKGAYLTAVLQGPPVFAHVPVEARSEKEKKMLRPVHRVRKAIYGMKRSGHDFDAHARDQLAKMGWKSLRELDAEPSLYVREVGK
jgi:hypothetical protein